MADEVFNQADVNKDQRLDLNEFRSLIEQNLSRGSINVAGNSGGGGGGGYGSGGYISGGGGGAYTLGGYESSSSGGYGDVNTALGGYSLAAGGGGGADLSSSQIESGLGGGQAGFNSYEQSSYSSSSGIGGGGLNATGLSGFDASGAGGGASSSSTYEASSSQQQVQQYATNAQGLYQDPNPQIVRRPAPGGAVTYTQNIKVRFLQPPAVPPPGPLIIKEVRPPQPPPPPPLVVRQRAPPLPQPPPLILRERPPPLPASVASQTVIRKLAALPVPPRSVIIERLPALPPRPRDIIIERWIPYGAMAKRKTIVQRAEAVKGYEKPRNVIIQYEAVQARIVRQFQRLGVTQENPQAYLQRYGASLFDAQTLLQQARAAGVIEDISPPAGVTGGLQSSSSFSAQYASGNSGAEGAGDIGLAGGAASSSSYEAASYAGGQQGEASLSGFESAQGADLGAGLGGGYGASYEASSYSSQGGVGYGGGAGASGYESYSSSAGGGAGAGNIDFAGAAFNAADTNRDGSIDANEFRQFVGSHLRQ